MNRDKLSEWRTEVTGVPAGFQSLYNCSYIEVNAWDKPNAAFPGVHNTLLNDY